MESILGEELVEVKSVIAKSGSCLFLRPKFLQKQKVLRCLKDFLRILEEFLKILHELPEWEIDNYPKNLSHHYQIELTKIL